MTDELKLNWVTPEVEEPIFSPGGFVTKHDGIHSLNVPRANTHLAKTGPVRPMGDIIYMGLRQDADGHLWVEICTLRQYKNRRINK